MAERAAPPRQSTATSQVWGKLTTLERRMEDGFAEIRKVFEDHRKATEAADAQLTNTLATIVHLLGEEKEDGKGEVLGTGLLGRMRRTEKSVQSLMTQYKIWIAFGAGFIMCAGGAGGLLWWAFGDKLALVLK